MMNLSDTTQFPPVILHMITAALEAADPYNLVAAHLRTKKPQDDRIFLVSVGKAAVAMANAALDTLPIHQGVVISKLPSASFADNIQYVQGSHPIPDQRSVQGTIAVRDMLAQTTKRDHVLCLISGGASALLTAPQIPLADWQSLNDALLGCGCTINEINHVRQHVDGVKGGGLLDWIAPATTTTLVLSDVIGNTLAHIGSGPTVPTQKDVGKVYEILAEYRVWESVATNTQKMLRMHLDNLDTTPKEFSPVTHTIVGDVRRAAKSAVSIAQAHGLHTVLKSTSLTGEARDVGHALAHRLRTLPTGTCYVYGGETTVTLRDDHGIGGRNQALALAAAIALDDAENCWLVTLATDGEDGTNDGAGAVVSGKTVSLARRMGLNALDYLDRQDSYTFFKQLGHGHLRMGSTGTNVNDLTMLVR